MKRKWVRWIISLMVVVMLASGVVVPSTLSGGQAEASNLLACQPYGPWAGASYNPDKLMKMLGDPRLGEVGPFLSAHRGAWGTDEGLPQQAPENSIAAIDNAAALKFEMVELDVKLTADKQLVLMHDYTLGRTTDYSEGQGLGVWNTFFGETHDGYRPQDDGDWETLAQYNPLVDTLTSSEITSTSLRLFDKNEGYLGTLDGASAIGQWGTGDYGTVPSLNQALKHIGNYYPGMTVVVDLRHLDEVKAAIAAIDATTDCTGRPAKDWVILKPFANVFKGGFFNAVNPLSTMPDPNSVWKLIGAHAVNYKWIPVVSNRLVAGNPQGSPSIIPGSPGPDISQIMGDVTQYLADWADRLGDSVVTFEIGVGEFSNAAIKSAYTTFKAQMTNMQSWRPPDVNVEQPIYDQATNRTLIGFNWKDDGTGAYPVYKESSRSYEETKRWAGVLTIEDPIYVIRSEAFTRKAAQLAISDVTDFGSGQYAIVSAGTGKALDVAAGIPADGTDVAIWSLHKMDNQLWRIESNGDGTVGLLNPATGRVLDLHENNTTNGTPVQIWSKLSNSAQRWRLGDNGDGTYRIIHAESGKVLDVDGNQSADGTKVQIWDSNGLAHQQWRIVPVETYMFRHPNETFMVLGLPAGSSIEGTPLKLLGPDFFSDHIAWRALNHVDGTFRLIHIRRGTDYIYSGGVMLDTQNHEAANGAILQSSWPSGSSSQNWLLTYNRGSATVSLRHAQSGKVVDVAGGVIDSSASIILYDYHDGSNQRWLVDDIE